MSVLAAYHVTNDELDRVAAVAGCEQEFFPDGHVKSNFLVNLGYGDASKLFPRSPRLEFDEACTLL